MRKLTAALATFVLVTAGLAAGAGSASARGENWTHVKPAGQHWTGENWTARKLVHRPWGENWT